MTSTCYRAYGVPLKQFTVETGKKGGGGFAKFEDRPGECFLTTLWGERGPTGALLDTMRAQGACRTFTAYKPHLDARAVEDLEKEGFKVRDDGVIFKKVSPGGPTPLRHGEVSKERCGRARAGDLTRETTTCTLSLHGRPVEHTTNSFGKDGHAKLAKTTTSMLRDARQCHLDTLYAEPEARGRGVGAASFDTTLDLLKRRGCKQAYWEACPFGKNPMSQRDLESWYKRRGGHNYPGGESNEFRKDL